WPTTWLSVGPCSENEPAGNTNPRSTDLVGASGLPAAFFQVDANYLYLRERILTSPSGPGGFANFAWVVLLQSATGNPFKYQWLISLDGKSERVELWENDAGTAADIGFDPIFNDPAETLEFSGATSTLARYVAAGSSIGGIANYFVDWAVPLAELTPR